MIVAAIHYTETMAKQDDKKSGFGEWLAKRIEDKGWTQEDIAERAGVHQVTISYYISGARNVSRKNAVAIARALLPDDPDEEFARQFVDRALLAAGFAAESPGPAGYVEIAPDVWVAAHRAQQLTAREKRAIMEMLRVDDEIENNPPKTPPRDD